MPTTRVFALFLLFCLCFAFVLPASAHDVYPSSIGRHIGSDTYQPDPYDLMYADTDLEHAVLIFAAEDDVISDPGDHIGTWWRLYRMTPQGLTDYLMWYNHQDPELRYALIEAGISSKHLRDLDPQIAEQIMSFFPLPKQITNLDDIRYLHSHASWHGRATDGQMIGADPQTLWPMKDYKKYMQDNYERGFPAEREATGAWYHPWTDVQPAPQLVGDANPFYDPTPQAAAWDMGWADGEIAGYLIGYDRHKWLQHNVTNFYSVKFPSAQYAQTYSNAFAAAWDVGYDRGVSDWQNGLLEEDIYLKERKRLADGISAAGPFLAGIAIVLSLVFHFCPVAP